MKRMLSKLEDRKSKCIKTVVIGSPFVHKKKNKTKAQNTYNHGIIINLIIKISFIVCMSQTKHARMSNSERKFQVCQCKVMRGSTHLPADEAEKQMMMLVKKIRACNCSSL
jgi:hypothetical protein